MLATQAITAHMRNPIVMDERVRCRATSARQVRDVR
jgi:hypothetical protein